MEDFEAIYEILSDAETMKYYLSPSSKEKVENWIKWNIDNHTTFGFGLWAIVLKENGRMIGDCGITMQNIHRKIKPEIGYHINKEYQSMGYATEAAMRCKDYIFEKTPFNIVFSYMKHTNMASAKVAQKNEMRLVDEFEAPVDNPQKFRLPLAKNGKTIK